MTELRKSAVDPDPLEQFRRWYADAEEAEIKVPQAMALATSTADGAPSVRMVLLKGADERGFVFFTGYVSRKAGELVANPHAALLFHWDPLGRQVRIEGRVERVAEQESDAYFATRPRGAQLAAAASQQSSVLRDRAEIAKRRGVDSATLAIAWLLAQPWVTAVVVGPRRPEHLEPALRALEHPLSAADAEEVGALF